eukprot:CAMPEP_0117544018 /NCGR_PEP_ID=MMETSP0784-20121206/45355_1 /TAXON_ID=39447 /ORGANISM="" /LENGTH=202 /DNA_ID=CAMNT_0005340805 /DNA_START=54 /DNA_END=662 /DNA_ORIENTATION=-
MRTCQELSPILRRHVRPAAQRGTCLATAVPLSQAAQKSVYQGMLESQGATRQGGGDEHRHHREHLPEGPGKTLSGLFFLVRHRPEGPEEVEDGERAENGPHDEGPKHHSVPRGPGVQAPGRSSKAIGENRHHALEAGRQLAARDPRPACDAAASQLGRLEAPPDSQQGQGRRNHPSNFMAQHEGVRPEPDVLLAPVAARRAA